MITLISHGFKFSRPDANFVWDVSYFKNPWRDSFIVDNLDNIGTKDRILHFMKQQKGCVDLVESISDSLEILDDNFSKENLRVAFCCSAGEYRSPAFVLLVAEQLDRKGINYQVEQSVNSKL